MLPELNSDKEFADAYKDSVDTSHWIVGKTYSIRSTSVCAVCTRPLYGQAHEEWHVRKHVEQMGLTYE